MDSSEKIKAIFYPEVNAGGFTLQDGTIEFYTRINALIHQSMTVLDFGAGRASWFEEESCEYRKNLRYLRGKVKKIVGCDVDADIKMNKSVDEVVKIEIGQPLPFDNEMFDLIICDFTFEHIAPAKQVVSELSRIIKPGGWICARTPNKYGYISILTRLIKNVHHSKIIQHAQPERKEIDVFPTFFKINTLSAVSKHFSKDKYENYSYRFETEPCYFFNSKLILLILKIINRCLPAALSSGLFIFVLKKN